jgi:hypothetical protein
MFICFISKSIYAQSFEAQQLLLNVEKLTQLKQILSDLKKGYEIVSRGYNMIKNISEGNFNLHQGFLDGLLQVSPVVRKYKRVVDIISNQTKIISEYKAAFAQFKQSRQFTPEELSYLSKVYSNLFDRSLKNLDALALVITAGKLRMSDDERLSAIDSIWKDVEEQLMFLRHFNANTKVLALQRLKEEGDISSLNKLYHVNK